MKVYALCEELGEYYTFPAAFQIFTSREQAEQAREGLIGKPQKQFADGSTSSWSWSPIELSIEEMDLQ